MEFSLVYRRYRKYVSACKTSIKKFHQTEKHYAEV
jgi:hypothetical protein